MPSLGLGEALHERLVPERGDGAEWSISSCSVMADADSAIASVALPWDRAVMPDGQPFVAGQQLRPGDRLVAQLVAGVGGVGDQLAQEDVGLRIDRVNHQVQQFGDFGLEGVGVSGLVLGHGVPLAGLVEGRRQCGATLRHQAHAASMMRCCGLPSRRSRAARGIARSGRLQQGERRQMVIEMAVRSAPWVSATAATAAATVPESPCAREQPVEQHSHSISCSPIGMLSAFIASNWPARGALRRRQASVSASSSTCIGRDIR
jgi:hypothetical protein